MQKPRFSPLIGLLILTGRKLNCRFSSPNWGLGGRKSGNLVCGLLMLTTLVACQAQDPPPAEKPLVPDLQTVTAAPPADPQISAYIRNMIEDKNGGFWLGTNGDGVAHYNGDTVVYFSNAEGFAGQQITGMTEDLEHNLWFATDQGVVKYEWSVDEDGEEAFVNYVQQQLYTGKLRFWSVFADSKGTLWGGTATGVVYLLGDKWMPFPLPYPEEVKAGDFITKTTTWGIEEDQDGNMWFSTNGYGAFKYDGESFTRYTKEDGLADDHVDDILADSQGNIWFGTRYGGVSRYDGSTFTNYTYKDVLGNNEVCAIYEDRAGNIWMSSEGYGVYRYDGASFINYGEEEGLGVRAVQTIFEDKAGRLWAGGGGGLYRLEGERFINVRKGGPWE